MTMAPSSHNAGQHAAPDAHRQPRHTTHQEPKITTLPAHAIDPSDKPLVFIDGQLLPKSKAMVSVFDHGFLYGDGVFEGIRVYNRTVFKRHSHLQRIYRNAERIHMMRQPEGFPYSKEQMADILQQCVEANDLTDGYIRLIFSRGPGSLGLNPFACPKPSVICIADQISLYPESMYQQGMRVVIAQRPRTPTACLDPSLKSLNYLNNILAKVEAIDDGCLEAIMLSTDGLVGECTGDNLFIVKNNRLYTSPLSVGMLDGITRAFVINTLAPQLALHVTEQPLTLDDVLDADEIFLTGSAAEIIAVTQVGDTRLSDGEGPTTKRLRDLFRQIVTSDDVPTD